MPPDQPPPADQPKRQYNNSKRQQQAEQTRRNILTALAKQLVSNRSPEFSVEAAAAAAGVTTRTIFRYFPNRESMLEALSDLVLETTGQVPIPQSSAQFLTISHATFRMFEQNSELIQALLLSELGRGVRSRLRERRRQGNAAALDEVVSHLGEGEQRAIKAVLVNLISAENWWQLKGTFQLDEPEASATVTWLIELVFAALARGEHPLAERANPPPSGDNATDE
ncbi:TetR/AcrR family transcriptional regulator [Halioxenophilus sp. WMMB6]|uniref:TetR/AcrR family transcriptional regulator n=1 Tax=Halioxenophilus sp. WMMB6 TaxID=3073815 RepID=UPI00295E9236|nr:TetR/AcrR family transcriptional regulator [Halioxenophilus sp. WMMB6]